MLPRFAFSISLFIGPKFLSGWLGVLGMAFALTVPLHAHGALHERMQQLLAALERNPSEARAHFELAEVFVRHGDFSLALASADSADEFQPGEFPTDLLRGEALLGLGRPSLARVALGRFLKSQPAHARALVLRARARRATDGPDAALSDYRAALRSSPRPNPDHVREAAEVFVTCEQHDEAIQILAHALAQLGPDPALLQQALELEISAGRTDDALAHITALQAHAPRPEPWMARRARVLTAASRPAEARAAWLVLLTHLDTLPNLERGSPALLAHAAEARAALAALTL